MMLNSRIIQFAFLHPLIYQASNFIFRDNSSKVQEASIKGFQSQMRGFELLIRGKSAKNDGHRNNEQCRLETVLPSLSRRNERAGFSLSHI